MRNGEVITVTGVGNLVSTYGRPNLVSIDGGATVAWVLDLKYPSHVHAKEAFLVQATPHIQNVTTWGERVPDRVSIEKSALESLKSGIVSVTLNMSGAEVSPKTLKSFSSDTPATWSVSIPTAGTHNAVISVEGPSDYQEGPSLEFKGDNTLTISAREPFFTVKNMLSLIAIILGPLVSIPGVFAFVKDIRNTKRPKTESRIILP